MGRYLSQSTRQIEATIAALEAQRGLLGDQTVDSALAPLRRELAALTARATGANNAQLRQVSVLFVDVVGSTAMGQQLQPEDIHAVMDGALERFTAVVEGNYGRVLQYTGDGMLAAFGCDEAHEDDAENAVRAALGILEEARRLAPEVLHMHGIPDFNVRAGVNTGTVLLGAGVDADGSIRGAVVNVAARMEQTAPPGSLRISHDTYRHVSGAFDVVEQPPLAIKGVDARVRSYVVQRIRPRVQQIVSRGIEGLRTRIVGRDRELGHLHATFDVVAAQRRARAITIIGDAGLGKTRLLAEFQETLEIRGAKFTALTARAHPRSALQPYDLLRDLVWRHLQVDESQGAAAMRDRLTQGLAPVFDDGDEASAQVIGHLAGIEFPASPHVAALLRDAEQLRERACAALSLMLRRLTQTHDAPVLVLVDDVHWSDDGSLQLLELLLQANRDMPLLLIMLGRPDLVERHPGWGDGDAQHLRLELAPLDQRHAIELAEVLLQRVEDIPAVLRALLVRAAEGNPFFMEELVKMLVDDEVIERGGEHWRVATDKLDLSRVPATLTGVLQVRLDSLPTDAREALKQAALVGQVFSEHAVASIDPAALLMLPALLRKGLIVRRATGAMGDQEYAFQHNLLHQVAYDAVLKAPKRDGHAKVGTFWAERAEVHAPSDVSPASCRALAEAHFHRCRADPLTYVDWFEAQFFNYLNAYATQTLRPLAESVVAVCEQHFGGDHSTTARALTNLARVMLVQGDNEQAEPILRRTIAIQQRDPGMDHPDTARSLAVLGGYYQARGEMRLAEPLQRSALAIRQRALGEEHPLTIGTLRYLAHTVSELGRYDEAERLSRRLLEIRERLLAPNDPDTALALRELADVLSKKNQHREAVALLRRALSIQEQSLPSDHADTALSHWNLAEALLGLGEFGEAEPIARSALQTWEKVFGPEHEWTAWSAGTLAKVLLAQGPAAEAAELAARAARIHEQRVGPEHPTFADALELHARALLALGDSGAAAPLLEKARAIRSAVQTLQAS
jgi:class 3 adenylate cyclase/tetratricopeptide (TPR) repeat protein